MMNGTQVVGGKYGSLPGDIQSVPRSELFAILQVLKAGSGKLVIYTDDLSVGGAYSRVGFDDITAYIEVTFDN